MHLLGIQYIQPTLPKAIAVFTALIRSTMEDNVYDALVSCLGESRSPPVEDSESAIMKGCPCFRLFSLSQPFIEAVGLNNYVVIILDLTYVVPFSREPEHALCKRRDGMCGVFMVVYPIQAT